MRGAAAWFGRVRAIGVAKSVGFEKISISFKIVLKRVKNSRETTQQQLIEEILKKEL